MEVDEEWVSHMVPLYNEGKGGKRLIHLHLHSEKKHKEMNVCTLLQRFEMEVWENGSIN